MALSSGIVWEVRIPGSDTNGGGFRGGANLATPSAPGVSTAASGGSVAAGTYYVVVTESDGNGETPKSSQTSVTTTGASSTITVTSPTTPNSQSTWNVYVGTTSGGPYFQQSTFNAFGSNKLIIVTPPTSGTQAPGVDYSQQNGAQVVIDNSTITATTTGANSNTITFTNYTPTAADVGNLVNITGGTNITAGRYEITDWASTTWTVSGAANLTTGSGAGSAITGNMGGALASPALAAGQSTSSAQIVFIKYNVTAYSCSSSNNVSGGNLNPGASNAYYFNGYDTTRSINNTDSNKPTLAAAANSMTVVNAGWGGKQFVNLIADANGNTSVTGFGSSRLWQEYINCKANACATGFNDSGNGVCAFTKCWAASCGTGFSITGAGSVCDSCAATSHTGTGFSTGGQAYALNCIATAGANNVTSYNATGAANLFKNCTAYSNGFTSHFGFNVPVSGPDGHFINCVAYGSNSGTGFNVNALAGSASGPGSVIQCAVGNFTTNYSGTYTRAFGLITLTANPFTNAGSNDFSLNNTAGGGAALRAAGFPSSFAGSTNNYMDIGAAQHQDLAGALAIDGHASTTATGGTSQSITLTTTNSQDIVVVCVFQEKGSGGGSAFTVTSVTGGGLTWQKRASVTNGVPVAAPNGMEVWWAYAASPLSSTSITVTINGTTDDWAFVAFGVTGSTSHTAPWDWNSSLPATITGPSPSCTISTSTSVAMLFAFYGDPANNSTRTNIPTGFTFLDGAGTSGGGLFAQVAVAYKFVTSLQSGLTVAWGSGTGNASDMIVDALTVDIPNAASSNAIILC